MDVMVPAEDGHWVNEKFARISEIITDYDPSLFLAWIPPENRTNQDTHPFAVMHRNPNNGKEYRMFTIKEDELDERVLQKIFLGDSRKHDVLAAMEAKDRADQLVKLKEKMEKAAEREEFISSVVGTHKHYFKHNGKVFHQ